ncbi:hypothetical protein NBRGN_060_01270 [Nocardia brasiliensis NBRC 14402]|nr:hypothetical protein NBRGN_060_01270 [Nocardia brasiliensis NBRC 14402]
MTTTSSATVRTHTTPRPGTAMVHRPRAGSRRPWWESRAVPTVPATPAVPRSPDPRHPRARNPFLHLCESARVAYR